MVHTIWPIGWKPVNDAVEKVALENELHREMPEGHILRGRTVSVLARHDRIDKVLFLLNDNTIAQVHLTWHAETDPFWPSTEIYECLGDWYKMTEV